MSSSSPTGNAGSPLETVGAEAGGVGHPYTAGDKLACVERELRYRRRVYPNLVAAGKMTAAKMRHELEVMAAIAADLRPLAQAERLL